MRPVEQVEKLRAELEFRTFPEGEVLEQREVRLDQVRSAQQVSSAVSVGELGGRGEG